ncbi:MAG: DUF2959 family protein [Oryzomonas sp.]|uniref:DUF2959 family protein n=1 Tax=Oryzomonas sp. TaxID=2855186 RepID=UPI002850B86F|nr:DUF2959 family protein [Oryzomonas sp.]MDR3579598.1 DUF2959 family protein [Oryzomonas sp.]
MKLGFKFAIFFTTVLLGTITCLTGCATTGMDRATKTTNSMQMVEGDYKQASVQIDATRATLEDLIKPDQNDMKKAYDAYTENVVKMEKLGKQLDTHTEKMRVKGNDYFAEWESSYTNPEIRELSERRRIEIREGYVKISEASIGVKGTLKSYLTDIREIQKYLSNDLTPQGIESIRPVAQRALTDGDNLKETVKPVLAAIDRVKVDMAQGGVNKGPATDGDQK